jgi:TatD DNase family protein
MYIDSHCHLDFDDFRGRVPELLGRMRENAVTHALCVSVTLAEFPNVLAIAEAHPNVFASVGVHPDYPDVGDVPVDALVERARHPRVVAIGETGLDYYRLKGDLEWQRERFRTHIRAARRTGLPLIIHTRSAADDTIRLMQEEGADAVGGVMHCFTESWDVAERALALGFHISFSGIVTFKSAADLREVARRVPADRLLIETDSPYLAPVPFRGKTNEPAFVKHVGAFVADLRGTTEAELGATTTENFFRLFSKARGEVMQ